MNKIVSALLIAALMMLSQRQAVAVAPQMSDYTSYPPFLSQTVPPLVMLVMAKDHKQFIKAYNDVTDLDNDGVADTTYKDTIQYDGYFDPNKCYSYVSANSRFEPQGAATGTNKHYCTGQWSGNFLNWSVMMRMDVVRKVLYGGRRIVDTSTTTVLSRSVLPWDGHSWAKYYNGSDIASLTPYSWTGITLCNTNTASTQTSSLIYVVNGYYPYAASTEAKQCVYQYNGGPALSPTVTYNADVLVCNSSMLESNCETYTDTSNVNHYKPTGLMQQLGIDRRGTATTTDDIVFMQFALITGSYGAHVGGGVLRSNIVNVNNEIDPATGMVAATSGIIYNIDRFKILQYNYSTGWYDGTGSTDNCHQNEVYTLSNNGLCTSWGNPQSEMLYETIRYFQGKTGPTTQFQQATPDPGLTSLTVTAWSDPYASCPYCAKPFVLLLSDPFPSYDSDHLPGSYWPTAISTSDTPSVQTLIGNATIDTLENIGSVFMGQSGATFDRNCTPKIGVFESIRGLCGEEPGKYGSYYVAGLANYGKTTDLRPDIQGTQNLTTYGVVTNSPFPNLQFTVGANTVTILPNFHDGCPLSSYPGCTSQGQNGDNSGGEIVDFQFCQNDADWQTEQANGYTSCYDILWDDADQGWDYELDVRYRIYVQTNAGANTITVKTRPLYAAAGHTDYAGYFINGVTGAGQYLDMACGGIAGFTDCDLYSGITSALDGMGNAVNTRTFAVTGSATAILKDPLWYAAKYGGFEDKDGTKTPNLTVEWDQDNNGVPDTYFYTANPLQLQQQLALSFYSILDKVNSGTSVSVLATSSTGDGSLYQAFFFPRQIQGINDIRWTGFTQALFVDEFGNTREDTDGDGRLVYNKDYIIITRFDPTTGNTVVDKYQDANNDGLADTSTPYSQNNLITQINPIWEAGKQLALTAPSARTITTWVDPNNNGLVDTGEQIAFNTANLPALTPYLLAGAAPMTATNIINWVQGTDITGLRPRTLSVTNNSGVTASQVWKLGDPVNSTPTVVRAPRERYDVLYGDSTYGTFFQQYKNRQQVVYLGSNDGMLHAFNGGYYNRGDDPSTTNVTEHGWFSTTGPTGAIGLSGQTFGQELFAFIPNQLLPQLQWLAQNNYTHVYYVDLKPKVTDVRIFNNDADHPGGWGTVLIGGFRMGGSCGNCGTGNAPPMQVTAVFDSSGTSTTRTFYSAYFVLDITNPASASYGTLLWSYSDSGLGLTTSYPAIVRTKPTCTASNCNADPTSEHWYVVLGSGPTGFDGSAGQTGKVVAIDLKAGPGTGNSLVTTFTTDVTAFTGDIIAADVDLDYRTDVSYFGDVISTGSTNPTWVGKLRRLATNKGTVAPAAWGITVGASPFSTTLLATFPAPSNATRVGPIVEAPTVSMDNTGLVWVYFGTGRYFSLADKTNTDTQYFFGVKDPVPTGGCTETSDTSCQKTQLVNVSSTTVCVACASGNQVTDPNNTTVTTVTGTSATTTLQGLIGSMDGWYTTLGTGTGMAGERSLTSPTVMGGTVFFTTFVPVSDVCVAAGNGYLYGLFYQTGSAYTAPILGTSPSGSNTVANRSVSLGMGMPSQVAIQIGAQGTGASGAIGNGTTSAGQGSTGRVTLVSQSSTGALSSVSANPALASWSRYISWINQRN